jgi:hypothetical protein
MTEETKPEPALDRLLRDNRLYLAWNRDRQIVEVRTAFVPIETPGFDQDHPEAA